jgi:hypothetical protein
LQAAFSAREIRRSWAELSSRNCTGYARAQADTAQMDECQIVRNIGQAPHWNRNQRDRLFDPVSTAGACSLVRRVNFLLTIPEINRQNDLLT